MTALASQFVCQLDVSAEAGQQDALPHPQLVLHGRHEEEGGLVVSPLYGPRRRPLALLLPHLEPLCLLHVH